LYRLRVKRPQPERSVGAGIGTVIQDQGRRLGKPTSLRTRELWARGAILVLLAGAHSVVMIGFMAQIDAADKAGRIRLMWQGALTCWLVALPAVWLMARLQSRWAVRGVGERIATLVHQCQEIGAGRAVPRLSYEGNDAELRNLALAVNDLLKYFNGFVACQRRFAADAAHELRTPLTAQIVVGENALARRCSSGELREVIGSMLEESKHMRLLIDNLLELARASAVAGVADDSPPRGPMPVELGKLARGCVDTLQVLAEEKHQHLELSISRVWADAAVTLIRQALLNVIHNAIEHCPEGTRIIVLSDRFSVNQAMIQVIDNGPGIPLERQPHVFRRFYRGCSSGARRGLGLGLSIADALLRSQRGQIHLASEPGNGCCFTLTLPLLAEPEADVVCNCDSEGHDMTVVPGPHPCGPYGSRTEIVTKSPNTLLKVPLVV